MWQKVGQGLLEYWLHKGICYLYIFPLSCFFPGKMRKSVSLLPKSSLVLISIIVVFDNLFPLIYLNLLSLSVSFFSPLLLLASSYSRLGYPASLVKWRTTLPEKSLMFQDYGQWYPFLRKPKLLLFLKTISRLISKF